MASTRAAVTRNDVRALMRGATVEARASAALKLCQRIGEAPMAGRDRASAQEVLRVIAADQAERVRQMLAATLRSSPVLPRDLALALARDVEPVAMPILEASPVFADEDLVAIVGEGDPSRQFAIAGRARLSERVTRALVRHGAEAAVRAACANPGARFLEESLHQAISRLTGSQPLLTAIACRPSLPPSVADRLVELAPDAVRVHVIGHHALTPDAAVRVTGVDLVDQAGRTPEPERFVDRLHAAGRLTPSLLLRALAHGHMSFFEWAVALLARVPHPRASMMIHDAGPLGLRAIYERAGLPIRLFPAFAAGVETFRSLQPVAGDGRRFQERMLERFLTRPGPAAPEDVEYLLQKLDPRPSAQTAASLLRAA